MIAPMIFVTGASGYLGAHIVGQLLEKGFRVKGTARGAKVDQVKQTFASYGNKLEVVSVQDVASDDLSGSLKGVDKVIHAAAPQHTTGDIDTILKGTVEGTLNLFRQAEKLGITQFVYTSSIVTIMDAKVSPWTNETWTSITKDDIDSPASAYLFGKTQAERAVWEFAAEHKHIDVTVVNPSYIFGPLRTYPPTPDFAALSTASQIHQLLKTNGTYPFMAGYIDVRDLARIHIHALNSPPESQVGRKRMLIASPLDLNYGEAVRYVAEARPELKDRLNDPDKAPKFPMDHLPTDLNRVAEVCDFKVEDFTPWKDTILDTVDSLIAMEQDWTSKGYKVEVPSYFEESQADPDFVDLGNVDHK